ncbi:hypothetical protein STEG23_022736 [Scotinomys teguina]
MYYRVAVYIFSSCPKASLVTEKRKGSDELSRVKDREGTSATIGIEDSITYRRSDEPFWKYHLQSWILQLWLIPGERGKILELKIPHTGITEDGDIMQVDINKTELTYGKTEIVKVAEFTQEFMHK